MVKKSLKIGSIRHTLPMNLGAGLVLMYDVKIEDEANATAWFILGRKRYAVPFKRASTQYKEIAKKVSEAYWGGELKQFELKGDLYGY